MVHSRDALIPTEGPEPTVLVPREPTEAMLNAACEIGPDTNGGPFSHDDARNIWLAMIGAAK